LGRGLDVSAVCLDYGQDDVTELEGVAIHKAYAPGEGLPVLRFIYPRLSKIWGAMKSADADVYYQRTAGMLTGLVAYFCKRYKRTFVYAGAHNTDFQPGSELIQYSRDKQFFRYGLRNADLVIAQNVRQAELLMENYGISAVQIPNCYPRPKHDENGTLLNSKDILWVSTIRDWKRPAMFMEIARKFPDHHFVMVGGAGSSVLEKQLYQRITKDAQEISNLDFAGFVPPN